MTVNCARLVKTDQHATNGIVHVVDRVITAVTNNVQSFLDTDDDLTTLQVWCYFLSLYFLARKVSECFYKIFWYSQQLCIIYYIDVRYLRFLFWTYHYIMHRIHLSSFILESCRWCWSYLTVGESGFLYTICSNQWSIWEDSWRNAEQNLERSSSSQR